VSLRRLLLRRSYVGRDAAYTFLENVLREAKRYKRTVHNVFKKKMVITPKQERKFQKATMLWEKIR
jgi:methylphosphotriester-DNA--protein-cysteine methyltransferase